MNERDVHLGTFLHFPFLFFHITRLYLSWAVQPFHYVDIFDKFEEQRHLVKEKE